MLRSTAAPAAMREANVSHNQSNVESDSMMKNKVATAIAKVRFKRAPSHCVTLDGLTSSRRMCPPRKRNNVSRDPIRQPSGRANEVPRHPRHGARRRVNSVGNINEWPSITHPLGSQASGTQAWFIRAESKLNFNLWAPCPELKRKNVPPFQKSQFIG